MSFLFIILFCCAIIIFMKITSHKIPLKHVKQHETKQHIFIKFSAIIILLLGYFFFVSQKYGAGQGILVTFITWSFFVLSTPIADAGFLLDFPLRLLLRIKMIYSEIIVWLIAISLNIFTLIYRPEIYEKTELLALFKKILTEPLPFWFIILISAIGTFISVYFGDELMNKVKHSERNFYHKHKYNYRFIIMIFIFAVTFILYGFLIKKLGIENLF